MFPRKPDSMHLAELPKPVVESVPDGRGVLVRLIRCGVDGTDKEINAGDCGQAPPGCDFLVTGHENFGRVEAVGTNITEFRPGDYVVTTVRRPGSSLYDRIGLYDMTTDDVYYEHGINLLHGFLTEYYVDHPDFIVRIPDGLRGVGVLTEPLSVAEKGIVQAHEIQRRLRVWRPAKAAVLGAGTIGLLATMILRLRGLDVATFGLMPPPYLNSTLIEALGARYLSTRASSLREAASRYGPFDLIFEATGYSPLVFEAMEVLGKDGILVLAGVTGGDRKAEISRGPDQPRVCAREQSGGRHRQRHREHFEAAARDLALAEAQYAGWTRRLLTHPVSGLENKRQLIDTLTSAKDAIKVFMEIAPAGGTS